MNGAETKMTISSKARVAHRLIAGCAIAAAVTGSSTLLGAALKRKADDAGAERRYEEGDEGWKVRGVAEEACHDHEDQSYGKGVLIDQLAFRIQEECTCGPQCA